MKPQPDLAFKTPKAFSAWLARQHAKSDGVWLLMHKKATGLPSINYQEALEEALCWGWIDGQKASRNATSWAQRFTPRRKRSKWSKRNVGIVARLIKEKRMKAPGLAEVNAAKADSRWGAAYDSPAKSKAPADFLRRLAKDKKAKAFYLSLGRVNLFAIHYRLQTAVKPETREKRMVQILNMLSMGKTFH